jgi:pSer/pThr/pTyr-binding forkhead associated (FHA) protein
VQEKPSTNGTKVNGQDITGQGRKELENGNEIKLSHVAEVTFQIDSDGQGKILLPNNTEILFEGDPKPVGRDDLAEFLNSVNLDPFEISRVHFTISKE